MKTFKEYLTENKKVYSFKIKVAGDVPENFQETLKIELDRCKVLTLEKIATTPIQQLPLDFPTLSNAEVTVFEVVCEYPINSQQIVSSLKTIGLDETFFRVRGSSEPSEIDQILMNSESKNDPFEDTAKIKHKDYFGDDFNKGFLKDLDKAAKTRKKDGVQTEYKLPKGKTDKAGAKSAVGS